MKTTRAKFNVTAVKNEDGSMNVNGSAVTSGCEENKAFNDATPGGSFYIHIAAGKEAQNSFEAGVTKEYYLDLIECEPSTSEATETAE